MSEGDTPFWFIYVIGLFVLLMFLLGLCVVIETVQHNYFP